MPDGTIVTGVPDDAADFGRELSPIMAGLLQSREYIIDRLPDAMKHGVFRPLPEDIRQGVSEAQPIASAIGENIFPVAASLAAPGKIPAQALLSGVLEATREGSDWRSIGTQAGLAGLGQGLGNATTRVMSGIARGVKAATQKSILPTTSRSARLVAETGLARGVIDKINQSALLNKLGKVFGIGDMVELGPQQLAQAADNIGQIYDDALDLTDTPDLSAVRGIIEGLDPSVLPGKARLLEQVDMATTPQGYRALHRTMRDLVPKLNQSQLPLVADEVAVAVGKLDDAGIAAGADPALMREAGQRWKVLRNIEAVPEAWQDGVLSAKKLATRFGAENYKGFGTRLKRGTLNVTGDVDDFLESVLTLAKDKAPVGSSGTAERGIVTGGSILGGAGALSGAIDPATLGAGMVAYGVVPPLAAAASVGDALPGVGKGIAAAATIAGREEQ
jgi:hypothetical protein